MGAIMLGLFAQLLSGLAAAATPAPTATCNVGLAALRDLPPVGTTQGTVDTYFDLDPSHHGLAEACPSVRENLPAGYAVADAAAWARANVHAPIPGKFTSPAFIYQIEIPKISADGMSAEVEWGYTCTGLCGGGLVSHYVRTPSGWQRRGGAEQKWVS